MTRDTIWHGEPCPNNGCPKPGPIRGWWFYRTKPWVCPVCCYGWIRQDPPVDHAAGMYRWVRTGQPVPYYRPGNRHARPLRPFR